MAGFWPRSEMELRSINMQKKKGHISGVILTEQAWSIKDLSCGFWENCPRGTWQVVLSRQDSSILPASQSRI